MKLSRETDYGLRGLAVLARRPPGQVTLLAEIARAGGLPYSFLSKIFQKLARHRIVTAHRGARRGYALSRGAAEITVREILEAVEGPDLGARCLLWDRDCSPARRCLLHPQSAAAALLLLAGLGKTSLADLAGAVPPPPRRQGFRRRAHPGAAEAARGRRAADPGPQRP